MHLADRQNYFTILRNLLVILFVTIPAWADHSNPDDLETVRLLISGGSGGLMGGHQARVILPMLQPESPFSSGVQTGRQNLAETRIGHSKVFKQKGCYLFSYPHLTIKKFMEKISSLGQRWALKIDKFPLLQDENGFIFSYPGRKLTRKDYFLLINRVLANFPSRIYKPRPAYARLYDASLEGKPVYLLCQNGDSPDQLEWQWDLWQTRWSVYQSIDRPSSQDRFMVISKYWGVGPRRIQAIKEVKKDHSQTILLDSGDILEGFSSLVHGRFSLHRANSLKMIKKLGFQALCPGELELSGGFSIYARQLKQIGIKPVITNVDTKDLQPYRAEPYGYLESGTVKIYYFCLLDTHLAAQLTSLEGKKMELLPPREVIYQHIKEIRRKDHWANHLFLAFLPKSGNYIQQLMGQSIPLDLLIWPGATQSAWGMQVKQNRDAIQTGPLLIPFDGGRQMVEVEVRINPYLPWRNFRWNYINLEDSKRVDQVAVQQLMRNRMPADSEMDSVILPDLTQYKSDKDLSPTFLKEFHPFLSYLYPELSPLEAAQSSPHLLYRFNPALMSVLAGNISIILFGADVAIIRRLDWNFQIPGAISRELVADWLAVPDKLVLLKLDGGALKKLIASLPSSSQLIKGDRESGYIGGRPINERRSYYLITTDRSLEMAGQDEMLKNSAWQRFKKRGARFFPHKDGVIQPLSALVLSFLDRLKREEQGKFSPVYYQRLKQVLMNHQKAVSPLWTLSMKDLDVSINNYSAWKNSDYKDFTENRANTSSNYTLVAGGDLVLAYDDYLFTWRNYSQARYGRIMYKDKLLESVETVDDLVFSSEFQLKFIALQLVTGFSATPFFSSQYDTEFTPSGENPRQKLLAGNLGFLLKCDSILKEVRLAGFADYDFTISDGTSSPGVKGGLLLSRQWDQMRLENHLQWLYYFPVKKPAANRFKYTMANRTSLLLPLSKAGLSFKIFADLFLFKGQEENLTLGHSWLWGLALSYGKVLVL